MLLPVVIVLVLIITGALIVLGLGQEVDHIATGAVTAAGHYEVSVTDADATSYLLRAVASVASTSVRSSSSCRASASISSSFFSMRSVT